MVSWSPMFFSSLYRLPCSPILWPHLISNSVFYSGMLPRSCSCGFHIHLSVSPLSQWTHFIVTYWELSIQEGFPELAWLKILLVHFLVNNLSVIFQVKRHLPLIFLVSNVLQCPVVINLMPLWIFMLYVTCLSHRESCWSPPPVFWNVLVWLGSGPGPTHWVAYKVGLYI